MVHSGTVVSSETSIKEAYYTGSFNLYIFGDVILHHSWQVCTVGNTGESVG